MDYLLKAATEYVEGKSNKWGQIAQEQVQGVIDWISRETQIRPERIRESSLSEEILALLLSTSAVSHYISLGNADAISQCVTLRIRSAVRNSELRGHLVSTEFREVDPELDTEDEWGIGQRFRPVYLMESVLEDTESYPASHSSFRPFDEIATDWRASFPRPDFEEQDVQQKSTVQGEPASLRFMESELYQAILKNPELMRSVDWRTFEKLLAQILEEFGYSIDLQRGTKDGGVDIFAIKRSGAFGTEKYLVQAKRWNSAVGVAPVRELAFLHDEHRMTKSCLATTATFTKGAWQLADLHKWRLTLKDFEGLQEWVKDAQDIRQAGTFFKSKGGIYVPK